MGLLSVLAPPASAKVLTGMPVRVAIGGKLERAVGLTPVAGSWQLRVGKTSITRAELVDETSETHDKWILVPEDDALSLDSERFVPTHSYRVALYAGDTVVEKGVVYLYAPRHAAARRVKFSAGEELAESSVRIVPKGAL